MSLGTPSAQALAYVDGCLPADQWGEFERSLSVDKRLAVCVEQWRLQNEAIRRIFSDRAPSEERGLAERVASPPLGELPPLGRDLPRRRESLGRDLRAQVVAPREKQKAARLSAGRHLARRAAAPLVGALICILSAAPLPIGPSWQMAHSAFSAYRTYAHAAETEFAGADSATLERWLRPQLGGWIAVPDLAAGGFALVGGRIVPGAEGPAGFALYKNSAGVRIGLLLESGEGAPARASRASGALNAVSLAAPAPEQAMLVAGGGAADLARLATLARFSAGPAR